jgi:hypothetical protein
MKRTKKPREILTVVPEVDDIVPRPDIPSVRLARLAIAFEQAHAVFFPASALEMAELASAVCANEGVKYWISPYGDSITCTKCRNTSRNANDVEKRYCGFCKVFHEDRP